MRKNKLQRLLPPPGSNGPFGGIAVFNGYSKEIIAELLKIANFDYMGNAEYEFGAIPKSLAYVANHKESMPLVEQTICGIEFFIIAERTKFSNYVAKIESWTKGDNYDGGGEYHGLQDISKGNNKRKIVGWLDIDEHVLFFLKNVDGTVMADRFDKVLSPQTT